MQGNKERSHEAQAVTNSISNANTSRNVRSNSSATLPEEKPRIRHALEKSSVIPLPSPRPMNKPILEGLDNAPSAYVQLKNGGYENPTLLNAKQRSQNSLRGPSQNFSKNSLNMSNSNFRLSGVKDYTYGLSEGKLQV